MDTRVSRKDWRLFKLWVTNCITNFNIMKIENAELGTKVIGPQIQGVAKIVHFWLSDANRCYVDCEQKDGNVVSTPLDMTIKY
jgi:hypothetical protein